MITKELFKKVRKVFNLSQEEFAPKIGLSTSMVGFIERGNKKISDGTEAKLKLLLQENNYKVVREDIVKVDDFDTNEYINPLLNPQSKHGKIPVKYYDVDFQAGSGIVFYEDNVAFPAYEMNIPAFSGCVAFNVFGESMEPLIKNGSVCFGRKKENWFDYLEYGQIYGIIMKNGHDRYLKYIRKNPNPQYFTLKSANPEFDPFDIPKKDIQNIWLIEGWMLKRT